MKLCGSIKIKCLHQITRCISAMVLMILTQQAMAISISGFINIYAMENELGEVLSGKDFVEARLIRSIRVTTDFDSADSGTFNLTPLPGAGSAPPHPTTPVVKGNLYVKPVVLKASVHQPEPKGEASTGKTSKKTKKPETKASKKSKTASPSGEKVCKRPLQNLPPLYSVAPTDTEPKTVFFSKASGSNQYELTLDGFAEYPFLSGTEKEFALRPDTFFHHWLDLESHFSRYGRRQGGATHRFFDESSIDRETAVLRYIWASGFADIIIGLTCEFRIRALFTGNSDIGYSLAGIHANQILPEPTGATANAALPQNLFLQFVPDEHEGSLTTNTDVLLTYNGDEDIDADWQESPEHGYLLQPTAYIHTQLAQGHPQGSSPYLPTTPDGSVTDSTPSSHTSGAHLQAMSNPQAASAPHQALFQSPVTPVTDSLHSSQNTPATASSYTTSAPTLPPRIRTFAPERPPKRGASLQEIEEYEERMRRRDSDSPTLEKKFYAGSNLTQAESEQFDSANNLSQSMKGYWDKDHFDGDGDGGASGAAMGLEISH